jgi:hypothetical protein
MAKHSQTLGKMAFAVLVLVENDLARADRSCLAVAGGDLVRSVQVYHVLSARRVMPVEMPIRRCRAKNDTGCAKRFRRGPVGTRFSQLNLDIAEVRLTILVGVKIMDAHKSPLVEIDRAAVVAA